MSAQRSRQRKKFEYKSIQHENEKLKNLVIEYQQKVIELQEENKNLK